MIEGLDGLQNEFGLPPNSDKKTVAKDELKEWNDQIEQRLQEYGDAVRSIEKGFEEGKEDARADFSRLYPDVTVTDEKTKNHILSTLYAGRMGILEGFKLVLEPLQLIIDCLETFPSGDDKGAEIVKTMASASLQKIIETINNMTRKFEAEKFVITHYLQNGSWPADAKRRSVLEEPPSSIVTADSTLFDAILF
jgi:hypothetical protein